MPQHISQCELKQKVVMQSAMNSGLRSELYADEVVWCDEIDALLSHLSPDCITTENGRFALLDGIYDHIGKYAPYPDTTQAGQGGETYPGAERRRTNDRTSCEFQFLVDDREGRTYWMAAVNALEVSYETLSGRDYQNLPETAQAASQQPDLNKSRGDSSSEDYYAIGGLLVDPLVTDEPEVAADHISSQLEEFADRICYLADLERFTDSPYGETPDTPEDYSDPRSPVNVHGIGEKTTKSLARSFGVYSNILFSDESVRGFTSASWGNQPEPDAAEENVKEVTDRYREFREQGATRTELQPEDLTDYPKPAPTSRITGKTP